MKLLAKKYATLCKKLRAASPFVLSVTAISGFFFLLLISSMLFSLLQTNISFLSKKVHADTGPTPIKHIVFIIKENHTFDNYFGLFPGVNGTSSGQVKVNGRTSTIPLNPFQDTVGVDYGHGFGNATQAYDNGLMDRFNQGTCSQAPYPCYQAATQNDLPNYWSYAQNFVLNDNAWSSLRGPSFPNHLFTVAGASGPTASQSAIANPVNTNGDWGCDAVGTANVQLQNGTKVFPCFDFTTLSDAMTNAGVSWKYYAPVLGENGYIWNTMDDINHIRNGTDWQKDVPWQQFTTDVSTGKLPQFSWVIAPGQFSEHPSPFVKNQYGSGNSMCQGENWTVQQINTLMDPANIDPQTGQPYWQDTAVIVTWDDFGGYYDHAVPQNIDQVGYGFRVPWLVISPFAYATDNAGVNAHISHSPLEFSSVLKFAEYVFSLPSLGTRDSSAGDLLTQFDFSQTHNSPLPLQVRTCPTPLSPTPTLRPTPTFTPTPTPVAAVDAQDNFQRSSQTFWGTASDGVHTWGADAAGKKNFSITNGTGQIGNGSGTFNAILGTSSTNGQVLLTASTSSFSTMSFGSLLRYADGNNFYRAFIDGTNLTITKRINGVVSTVKKVPFAATSATLYAIRFQVVGTAVSAKVWVNGTPEPANWMASGTDSSLLTGMNGLRVQVATGATITVTAFTGFSLQ